MNNAQSFAAATPTAPVALTIYVEALNLPKLYELIDQFAASGDPDRIAQIRVDEANFCAELDIAARPTCSDTAH